VCSASRRHLPPARLAPLPPSGLRVGGLLSLFLGLSANSTADDRFTAAIAPFTPCHGCPPTHGKPLTLPPLFATPPQTNALSHEADIATTCICDRRRMRREYSPIQRDGVTLRCLEFKADSCP
jgi:hypothetical protein